MARLVNKLSALKVANISKRGLYSDGNGLWLQVTASGSKSWVFRFDFAERGTTWALAQTAICLWRRRVPWSRISRVGYAPARIPWPSGSIRSQCAMQRRRGR
ncbi:MAG: Arm DNA-binding domain-containing protein [Telluria sp.]